MLLIADRSQRGGWWSGSRSSGALCACQWKDSRPYYSEWKSIGSCCFDPRRRCLHTNERFTLHTAQELNSIIISLSLARQLLVSAGRSIKNKKKKRKGREQTEHGGCILRILNDQHWNMFYGCNRIRLKPINRL